MNRHSWETSATGIGAILVAIGNALQFQFDGDPATLPNWGIALSLIIAGVGLLRARDNNKSSEDVGTKPDK